MRDRCSRTCSRGMTAGANVRGAMIGRNVLYPGADDPRAAIAAAVASIVHEGGGVDEALASDGRRARQGARAHVRSIERHHGGCAASRRISREDPMSQPSASRA